MPPKKANTKAKATPAKAAAVAEPPATVTNAKGKEFETTAAAGRSRRASSAVEKPATNAKAAPKKTAVAKKGTATKKTEAKPSTTTSTASNGKKRGRPAKEAAEEVEAEPPAKRGRPAKTAPAVPAKEGAPPKKRGRPPKGGETTQVEADEEAAAEQLEEELDENAKAEEGAGEAPSKRTSPTKRKRGRPAKVNGKGKGKDAAAATDGADDAEQEEEDVMINGAAGKQYWLMKAEQEDREEKLKDGSVFNAKFTIDDLRDKAGAEPWDGVRNATACKNMKDMKLGDLAFFYASGGKKGRTPGIVGIMEVVKEAEPDLSALDENSAYYVENAKMRGTEAKPRWYMVHVEFRKKLSKPVTLDELKKLAAAGGVLAEMQEFKHARLSVSKVSEEEWNFILNNLVEGYEDDDALPTTANGLDSAMEDAGLPNGVAKSTEIAESDMPTTDTVLAADTAVTSSRPGSRAGSVKKSTSRPGSRAGSLAPPLRAPSRGRSRTPAARASSAQPMGAVADKMDVIEE